MNEAFLDTEQMITLATPGVTAGMRYTFELRRPGGAHLLFEIDEGAPVLDALSTKIDGTPVNSPVYGPGEFHFCAVRDTVSQKDWDPRSGKCACKKRGDA